MHTFLGIYMRVAFPPVEGDPHVLHDVVGHGFPTLDGHPVVEQPETGFLSPFVGQEGEQWAEVVRGDLSFALAVGDRFLRLVSEGNGDVPHVVPLLAQVLCVVGAFLSSDLDGVRQRLQQRGVGLLGQLSVHEVHDTAEGDFLEVALLVLMVLSEQSSDVVRVCGSRILASTLATDAGTGLPCNRSSSR